MATSLMTEAPTRSKQVYIDTFQSEPGQGNDFINFITGYLQDNNWIDDDIYAVNMSMLEAVNNAIEHGNEMNPAKQVRICCEVTDNYIRIAIRDEGNGFDPEDLPDPRCPDRIECPHGRGVFIMRNLMSKVWYNRLGNVVFMKKYRTSAL